MKVKFKRLNELATVPSYAKSGDACFDLVATSVKVSRGMLNYLEYGTGIAVEIPEGHVGLIFPRSSVTDKNLMLKNSVGVIDSGYRGEIKFRFDITSTNPDADEALLYKPDDRLVYQVGDRIGQMMILPIPTVELEEVDELSITERGEGGYGSTGH